MKEHQLTLKNQEREEGEKRMREKMEEEMTFKNKLLKNVQQLEQRRMEVQRELMAKSRLSSGETLRSAVVVPKSDAGDKT